MSSLNVNLSFGMNSDIVQLLRCNGVTDRGSEGRITHAELNVKTEPRLSLYSCFGILLVFSSFLRLSEYPSVI